MIGKLNRRATLLKKVRSDDGGGGYTESWTGFAAVWATLKAMGGNDVFGPDALEARGKYRIDLRRRTDVTAGMRVEIASRRFDIVVVEDEGPAASFITLICEEMP